MEQLDRAQERKAEEAAGRRLEVLRRRKAVEGRGRGKEVWA